MNQKDLESAHYNKGHEVSTIRVSGGITFAYANGAGP